MNWVGFAISLLFISFGDARFAPKRNCSNYQFECVDGECIHKRFWCVQGDTIFHGRRCRDSRSYRNCGAAFPDCMEAYCTENKRCIPRKWICDGYQDCPYGSDEKECLPGGYRLRDVPEIGYSRNRAKSWILRNKKNYGWKKDTARAIIALYLSNSIEFNSGQMNSTNDLMIQEFKLQVVESILRNRSEPVLPHQIANYVHALLVTCQNPRDFFGFNLVGYLRRMIEMSASPNPFVALALCNANDTLSTLDIFDLLKLSFDEVKPDDLDSYSIALMTFHCLRKRNEVPFLLALNLLQNKTSSTSTWADSSNKNRNLSHLQLEDGSFGTVYTTALMLHALLANSSNNSIINFDIERAISYLLSKQNKDGSFKDFMSTYMVLSLLGGKTLVDLGNVNCATQISTNLTVQEEFNEMKIKKQKVGYFVWIGSQMDVMFSIYTRVPINVTFFDVMRLAAELDPRYKFEYIIYPWGKYIYSIFNILNDPEARNYWQLYRIDGNKQVPLNQTPDNVIPKDNEEYVFWYKEKLGK